MILFIKIIILFYITIPLIACDDFNKNDLLENWLGNKSQFSKNYKKGKCALDKALINMSIKEKQSIANLISKSYVLEGKYKSYNYY